MTLSLVGNQGLWDEEDRWGPGRFLQRDQTSPCLGRPTQRVGYGVQLSPQVPRPGCVPTEVPSAGRIPPIQPHRAGAQLQTLDFRWTWPLGQEGEGWAGWRGDQSKRLGGHAADSRCLEKPLEKVSSCLWSKTRIYVPGNQGEIPARSWQLPVCQRLPVTMNT